MEPRTGKVVNGAIVLEDDGAGDLVEGASVVVWIGDPQEPVVASDEDLALIDRGRQSAARGNFLDARAFLRELRHGE